MSRLRRPRLFPRTLRTRLVLGVIALMAVTFVGIDFATTRALSDFLVARVDQQLDDAGVRYAVSLERDAGGGGNAHADSRGVSAGTLGVRLVNGRVTTAAVVDGGTQDSATAADQSGQNRMLTLSATDQARLAALTPGGSPATVELSGVGSYRVEAFSGQDGDVLVTGLPMRPVEATVHKLGDIELAVFAIALAAAGALGAAWIGLALRPLDRVTRTAERVSSLSLASGDVALSVRVPDEDPRSEVGRVGASLNRMLGHVEDALEKRHAVESRLRTFAADASHELRTPVAAVRGHAELALRSPEPMPDSVRRSLTRIDAESQRMGVIVEDLLLLARLDAGRSLAREEVDLTRLALDAVDDARAAGPAHRWRLDLPERPVVLVGDRHRLAQVVANLLANARIHTPEGTAVTLRVAVPAAPGEAGGKGGAVVLSVTDDGPGMDPELAARAFDRFVRGDKTRSRASGGTGLGLAITRAIVEAHGGQATLTTAPGRTTVELTLPGPVRSESAERPDPTPNEECVG
ncbi:HAMP domain-containing histidine kinase [Actinospica sp. MGRD01-02]|uniref:histidine kinase n=1 Tax=Actinospica acidithermotolerans TaxID=2828514 RepID=A0A941IIS1_9ACTN|nr:HAMP domain-containing histidine kinase [Actinospica acidithermotolerans]